MSKNLILSGKEYSKNTHLQDVAESCGISPFITVNPVEEKAADIQASPNTWNRVSPISAHSVIINAENFFTSIDGAVLFFDTNAVDHLFTRTSIDQFTKATDELILGYTYLTTEIIKRFSEKLPGKLFFVLQSMDTLADSFIKPAKQGMPQQKAGIIPSMAQAAFKAFAENTAAENYNKNGSFIYLLETSSETTDQEILNWISAKMDEPAQIYKNLKQVVTWQSVDGKSRFPINLPFSK